MSINVDRETFKFLNNNPNTRYGAIKWIQNRLFFSLIIQWWAVKLEQATNPTCINKATRNQTGNQLQKFHANWSLRLVERKLFCNLTLHYLIIFWFYSLNRERTREILRYLNTNKRTSPYSCRLVHVVQVSGLNLELILEFAIALRFISLFLERAPNQFSSWLFISYIHRSVDGLEMIDSLTVIEMSIVISGTK